MNFKIFLSRKKNVVVVVVVVVNENINRRLNKQGKQFNIDGKDDKTNSPAVFNSGEKE